MTGESEGLADISADINKAKVIDRISNAPIEFLQARDRKMSWSIDGAREGQGICCRSR